ncbi:hypothetical protein ABZP36_034779 [Zizania latifolia]
MEIPTAAINRLQSSVREAASAPTASAPSTCPSVTDAIAAFDSCVGPVVSLGLQCSCCGAMGGLLHGAESAVCMYCGSPRREECGGIAFHDSVAYRWLLGSLELDELEDDPRATTVEGTMPVGFSNGAEGVGTVGGRGSAGGRRGRKRALMDPADRAAMQRQKRMIKNCVYIAELEAQVAQLEEEHAQLLREHVNHSDDITSKESSWEIKGNGLFGRDVVFSLQTPVDVKTGEHISVFCRQRQIDDKWKHDLYWEDDESTSGFAGQRDSGARDLREMLSGTMHPQPSSADPLKAKPISEVVKVTRHENADEMPVRQSKKASKPTSSKKTSQPKIQVEWSNGKFWSGRYLTNTP